MAIKSEYSYGGYTIPEAYIKASIGRANVATTVVVFEVWPTQTDREALRQPVDTGARVIATNLNLAADNPIAYAYELLKTLPEFAEAIDVLET